jgi:hypothetical protein
MEETTREKHNGMMSGEERGSGRFYHFFVKSVVSSLQFVEHFFATVLSFPKLNKRVFSTVKRSGKT